MTTAAATLPSAFDALSRYDGHHSETVKLVNLPLDAILIPDFQRDRILPHIKKLKAEWDPTAYVFPVVAFFKGNLINLDGQQRLAAAEEIGKDKVVCLLIEGIGSRERLANLFLKFNRDRRLLNAFQKFVAALEAKDRGSLSIQRILASYEKHIAKKASGNGGCPAGAVTKIHASGGDDHLERVIRTIAQAWPTPSQEAHEGETLLGLSQFIRRDWERIDDARLVAVLRKHHPGYLLEAANQRRGPFRAAYSDQIRDLYNKGLRGKGRL